MAAERASLLLGADIGGTSTRVGVAELAPDGSVRLLAIGHGGAGNPNAVGLAGSARQIAEVASDALDRARVAVDGAGAEVVSTVLGMAGYTAVTDPDSFFADALPGVDPATVRVVPDFAIAFSSATPATAGYVVLAGTGAGAVEIVDGEVTGRRDAWGWLLGDLGSGFWIGREAVRATLSQLQHGVPLGPVARAVLDRAEAVDLNSLLRATYQRPPIWLAGLAPTVSEAVGRDPVADRISAQAGAHLAEALLDLQPLADRPVVTTGSVLQHHARVRAELLALIEPRLDNPVRHAASGLAGALWMSAEQARAPHRAGERNVEVREREHDALVSAVAATTPR